MLPPSERWAKRSGFHIQCSLISIGKAKQKASKITAYGKKHLKGLVFSVPDFDPNYSLATVVVLPSQQTFTFLGEDISTMNKDIQLFVMPANYAPVKAAEIRFLQTTSRGC